MSLYFLLVLILLILLMDNSKKLKIIIILGFSLEFDEKTKQYKETKELGERLKKAAELYELNDNVKTFLICSGKGRSYINTPVAEAYVMKEYLLSQTLKDNNKINEEYIICEPYSLDTVENYIFSFFDIYNKFKDYLNNSSNKIEINIVTSDWHIPRSELILNEFKNFKKSKFAFIINSCDIKFISVDFNIERAKTDFDNFQNYSLPRINKYLNNKKNYKNFFTKRLLKFDEKQIQEFKDFIIKYS